MTQLPAESFHTAWRQVATQHVSNQDITATYYFTGRRIQQRQANRRTSLDRFTYAPARSTRRTTSTWAFDAAMTRGVPPNCTSIPPTPPQPTPPAKLQRHQSVAKSPHINTRSAARRRSQQIQPPQVLCTYSRTSGARSTSAPAPTSRSTTATCPFDDAMKRGVVPYCSSNP